MGLQTASGSFLLGLMDLWGFHQVIGYSPALVVRALADMLSVSMGYRR
jgi:hypothetical protein